jgi:nicotinamide riboside kinase
MALTPSWMTNSEGEEVYIDKGAVSMPQINPEVDRKYMAAKTEADAVDYVEWPTMVHGQESQGF